jgi:type VI secretion system protein
MQHALFEVLTGCYSNGQPIESIARASDVQMSIMDHLTRLLNARQGCMGHDPEYGLPDIGRIYQGLPYTVNELVDVIRKAILKYEPRLLRVEVNYKPIKTDDCVLHLEVAARLQNGEYVSYDTYFLSGGHAEVKPGPRRN